MTEVLNGLYNLLDFIEKNWGIIAAIVVTVVSISKKIVAFISKSKEERLEIAKAQISETMLKWVTKAECNYETWVSAGAVKRSEVIDEILAKYPVLSQVTNQQEIIAWLDDAIDDALKEMRKIFEQNAKKELESTEVVPEC